MTSSSHFDAVWYLEKYPDVLAAGIDPHEHFIMYGKQEGRSPHYIKAVDLEAKVFGGFSNHAIAELEILYRSENTSPYETSYAAWALGRWFSSIQNWHKATPYLNSAYDASSTTLDKLQVGVTLINSLLQLGDIGKAERILSSLYKSNPHSPELYLSAANILASAKPDKNLLNRRLACINAIYLKAGLLPVSLRERSEALSFENLTAPPITKLSFPHKVSVLVPTFNAADHLSTTLSGILNQTWDNLEVIVVDDCSTDGTFELAKEFSNFDDRVKVTRNDLNRGAYAARNTGLSIVSGDFITNHDSDDWSHPQRIQILVESLLEQPEKMGVMAHWVRADDNLFFQALRLEDRLIHASVSTLLVRRQVFEKLGGWDVSRVAADSELLERIKLSFGFSSVYSAYPGVPLVFARHHLNSLTNASATHIKSQYWGVRKLYRMIAERWRARTPQDNLYLSANSLFNTFKVPNALSSLRGVPTTFDIVIYGNLSLDSKNFDIAIHFIETLFATGRTVAVFHWPNYKAARLTDIADYFLDRMLEGSLYILSPGERAITDNLLIIDQDILAESPDTLPCVEFFGCELLDLTRLDDTYNHFTKISHSDYKLVENSDLFSSSWYLEAYEDVARAGISPLEHYMSHGAFEGRIPSPVFNAERYLSYFKGLTPIEVPALLHYLKLGKYMSLDASNPVFKGKEDNNNYPFIMVCGHAANTQLYGAELSLLDLIDAYSACEVNLVVTLPSSMNTSYIECIRSKVHAIHIVPCQLWTERTNPDVYFVRVYESLIKQYNLKVVHVNTITLREPILAAQNLKAFSFIHARESVQHDPELCKLVGLHPAEIISYVCKSTNFIIANSEFTAGIFNNARSTFTLPNIVDTYKFDIPNNISKDCINIALISSNLPKKGVQDFIDIAGILQASTPQARFLIIGPRNNFIANLQSELKPMPTNLKFMDYISNPVEAIKLSNIVVNLSHFEETFGRTILEALTASRPVVAYDHGAVSDLITHGSDGYLIPPLDKYAAAEALKKLCQDPEFILSMGEAGRKKVFGNFTRKHMIKKLKQIYARIDISI
ncbi:glycosyltransferase [Pseudomonas sp. WHRI 8519]|uniref:glycosyltransferase n=1 Tax=Pseudomonas sp. WHRI 8519 TaxID=3162567 RepID=UPI0032EB9CCC